MVQINGFKTDTKYAKVEPEYFKGDTLGAKFGNTLLGFFKRATNGVTDWFEERLINFAVGVLVKIETSGKTIFAPLIKELKKHNAIPPFLKPIFDEVEDPKHEIGAMLADSAGSSAIGGLMGAIFDPIMAPAKYALNAFYQPYIPGIGELIAIDRRQIPFTPDLVELARKNGFSEDYLKLFIEASKNTLDLNRIDEARLRDILKEEWENIYYKRLGFNIDDIAMLKKLRWKIIPVTEAIMHYFRSNTTLEELYNQTAKNGVDKDFTDKLITVNRQLLGLADIRSLYYRENKGDAWLTTQLKTLGYSEDNIENIKKILPYFPAVPDLIRFAVREVYSPEIVKQYGQMEDLPTKFLEEAKKAGLPEDQAKNFWAAHWELPGFREGAEMLHRGKISYEDLKTLLRTLDVMPFWREKLIEIAYSPYTRVDVRRMFSTGILTREQVKTSYKDIGYDEEHAENLTKWTCLTVGSAEKNLTKSDIVDGYKRKAINKGEATAYIQFLGYDQTEAEFYLSKVDYQEEVEQKKEILKLIEEQYKKGIISENDVISMLSAQGLLALEISYHLSKWTPAKKAKVTSPAKEDLKKWLTSKIITREEFIIEMSGLGYANKYINYYLKELKQKEI